MTDLEAYEHWFATTSGTRFGFDAWQAGVKHERETALSLTDLEALTAAYIEACKDRPADHNEIGLWYFRKAWEAGIKHEREACVEVCEDYAIKSTFDGDPESDHEGGAYYCADMIRARSAAPEILEK